MTDPDVLSDIDAQLRECDITLKQALCDGDLERHDRAQAHIDILLDKRNEVKDT